MIWKILLLLSMVFNIVLYRQYDKCLLEVTKLSGESAALVAAISDALTKERDDGTTLTRPLMSDYSLLQNYVKGRDVTNTGRGKIRREDN